MVISCETVQIEVVGFHLKMRELVCGFEQRNMISVFNLFIGYIGLRKRPHTFLSVLRQRLLELVRF
jgi:hypothetical protein